MIAVDGIGVAGRAVVMGIVNVTPDSFSDGGHYDSTARAVARGVELARLGADIVDVGGESTRPGALRVDEQTECERVLPVIAELSARGVATSIDTMRASVAAKAVSAGSKLVNDASGGLADPAMLMTVAELAVPIVLMHWRGQSKNMDELTDYGDVVAEVAEQLAHRRDDALAAGINRDAIVLDPGLGFAKLAHHNWELLSNLAKLTEIGQPVLIGVSRKRFIGSALGGVDGTPRPVEQRDAGTDAVSALAVVNGAWGVRVHDVPGTLDAVRIAHCWRSGGEQ